MTPKQGRYSIFLRPFAYFLDLAIIIFCALQFQFGQTDFIYYSIFAAIGWFFLSFNSKFYEVYRFTKVTRIIALSIQQLVLFSLIVFSFFGIFQNMVLPLYEISTYIIQVFIAILFAKLGVYYLLQRYRKYLGGNYRRTVIIGNNAKTRQLRHFFTHNPSFGYQYTKTFNLTKTSNHPENSTFKACFKFILEEGIDEIYCSLAELDDKQIKALVNFADNNLKVLKFIPDNKDIYAKHLKLDYYDYLPILSLRNIPIENQLNKFIKRSFDILISIIVIIGVLSWLTPILAIIIKTSSKGPVFFRQLRNGLDYKEFYCYKFRSMKINKEANTLLVSKNDTRVTRIGNFMRKTSIDELPQFFNVLIGNMSAVGPRPHMVSVSNEYLETIDKFMVRHFIKPGITGLAQVSGYRGEMKTKGDVINRVRYDIFYIENWSLLLDIKIIVQTVYNAIKGDDKAY